MFTQNQIISTLSLSETLPLLFSGTTISVNTFATHIDIISQPNADQKDCQRVLLSIFPEGDFGESHLVDSEGSLTENFKLIDPSSAYITLYMKKEPEKEVWTAEDILRQEA